MISIRQKAEALVAKYEPTFAAIGIICKLSQRYCETDVESRNISMGGGDPVTELLQYAVEEKRERKRYKNQKNRYKLFVLTFYPADHSLNKNTCREYSFIIEKVSRSHRGMAPEHSSIEEEKVLKKIEKRLQKMEIRAKQSSVIRVCQDRFKDSFRYFFSKKYIYKKTIFGRSRDFWFYCYFAAAITIAVIIIAIFALIL